MIKYNNLKWLPGNVLAACVTAVSCANAGQLSDGEIIGIYNQLNTFDVENATLAVSIGYAQEVRELASTIASDHRAVRLEAAVLAEEIGAEVSLPPSRQRAGLKHYDQAAKCRGRRSALRTLSRAGSRGGGVCPSSRRTPAQLAGRRTKQV